MSSSEAENFDIDDISGSESEDYEPIVKKKATKAAPKAAPTKAKAAPKSRACPRKKKPLVDVDDNGSDSEADVQANATSTADEAGPSNHQPAATDKKKKSASETYTKLSQLEHILKRPDSYIGSVETITQAMWTYDSETKRMVHREVKYVPGFFKIVDEILVNAADNKINDPSMDTLKVDIDLEEGTISVYNNGRGIPIEIHSREKIYIPELIFGHLLSSSNYDDEEKKLTGGRNGYGAKLANIYSHEFTIDTADKSSGQKYKQTWTDNMSKVGKPKITKNGRGEEYTCVKFKPDLQRFGMDSIDDDTVSLLKRRVFDLAGTIKDVKVSLNGERLKIKNFKHYVEMYLNSAVASAEEASGGAAQAKPTVIHEQIDTRWEVAFSVSEGTFQQVSFANSIATTKGGTHVNYIADQIAKNLMAAITKKNKGATVKAPQVKNHMWIFVNALIENPTFDSQTKETLTLPASKFGSKPTLSEDFMKKVQKSSIVDHVLNWAKFKADQQIKKTDGTKRTRLTGLTKLSDANNAGGKQGNQCTLILTEGDSAKALAIAGLSVVGRDNFGVFPLRGKLLNVREAKHDQIMKNEEIQNIKKIMGLQHNKEYTNVSSLRYGRLMIMTDQDHDGSHIKGLLINYLDHFYPSLLKIPDFLVEFVTPIVRVTKGNKQLDFFTIPEYEQWLEDTPDSHKWSAKYYKGLGTSSDVDARGYFSNMKKHMIPFATTQDGDRELIELAFSKKKADERKEWLRQFKPGTYLDHNIDEIPFSDFINRELILFSMADNIRSIPSVADGLKPGQRKIIWGVLKRKLKKEIKVAQLVGYIAEHAAYHHGEQSLAITIIGLAQDFVGSNNLSLMRPNGQFGTRDLGGKDHAHPRYIFTEPASVMRSVFPVADDPLLNYLKEDSDWIEPEYYVPVLPMVLINGAEGIGTGWSTSIPCYNPVDIVKNLRHLMDGQEQEPMLPWWRGFKGTIKKVGDHKYDVCGVVRKINDTTVEITELPIHKWTSVYKAELEAMIGEKGDGPVKDYKEHHDNTNVHFIITMSASALAKAEEQGLMEFFKLTGKINTGNMICFDFESKIKKYNSPEEIIEEFYPIRLAHYQKRKDYLANELQNQLDKLSNQARFVQMIVDKELVVSNRKKVDIVAELRKKNFRPFPKVAKAKAAGETDQIVELENAEEEEAATGASSDYDYLLGMAIWSLTKEKIERLRQQASEKEQELLALLALTPIQLWNTDLDQFLEEWERSCREWDDKSTKDANGKTVKRKQKVLEHRKSLPGKKKGDDEDEDDDYRPTKAAPKSKAGDQTAQRPKAATAGPSKKAARKDKSDDGDGDGDDDYVKVPPKKPAATRRPAPPKSDSDIEMVEKLAPKKAPAKKKVASESESEASNTRGKGKTKAAQAAKRKSSESNADNSDDDLYLQPVKKRKAQQPVTDFFDKVPKKTQSRKPSGSKAPAAQPRKASKKVDSDDELEMSDAPPPPLTKRPTRVAAKKYIEVTSDDDGDGENGDMSLYADD
ncbi:type II DNA topoisomerase [Neolentinus lepideus HHB14362 ss-1]|uniref:DNA topoisomerase 2 n=1 Tax=Neolentinus lepideus HHB14362 ss-1 TaxID=1314782 RepID=A0A165S520_9AGAM|nr:type II DNA topoisomerase [Neolentinus lepideus HHB14362 ss-1]